MVKKSALIALIERGQAELVRFADNLTPAEQNTIGVGTTWSARDLLAHLVAWKTRNTEYFNQSDRGETVPSVADIDHENADIVEASRKLSWEELRRQVDDVLPAAMALVERLSEEELNDPQRYPHLDGRPAWRNIMGDAFLHPLASHLRPWYIAHGQVEYASHLAEEEARLQLDLDDAPDWQGVTIYNLACHYALIGEKDKALKKLEEGLQLNPTLAQFAPQDGDFASLHDDPDFKAITTRAAAA